MRTLWQKILHGKYTPKIGIEGGIKKTILSN